MNKGKIHIDEENTQIIWGLIAVVCIGLATYLLINAFMTGSWEIAGYTQLLSLALFSVGFYGIISISSPLFHFVLYTKEDRLIIEIWKESENPLDIQEIPLHTIDELRIAPHSPRAANEALFDFSSSYYLLFRINEQDDFKRLIDLENESFTLKVKDIIEIMKFIISCNPDIEVPAPDSIFIDFHHPNNSDSTHTIAG